MRTIASRVKPGPLSVVMAMHDGSPLSRTIEQGPLKLDVANAIVVQAVSRAWIA